MLDIEKIKIEELMKAVNVTSMHALYSKINEFKSCTGILDNLKIAYNSEITTL